MSKNGLISLRMARNQKIRNNSNEASSISACIFFNGNSKWAYWNIPNFSRMWDVSTQQKQGTSRGYRGISITIIQYLLRTVLCASCGLYPIFSGSYFLVTQWTDRSWTNPFLAVTTSPAKLRAEIAVPKKAKKRIPSKL